MNYPSNLTDSEWAMISDFFKCGKYGNRSVHDKRSLVLCHNCALHDFAKKVLNHEYRLLIEVLCYKDLTTHLLWRCLMIGYLVHAFCKKI